MPTPIAIAPEHPTISPKTTGFLPERGALAVPTSPAEQLAASSNYLSELCHKKVGNTTYYQTLKTQPNLHPNQTYIRAARALVADRDAPLQPFERTLISLSAELGRFMYAGQKLDDLRDKGRLTPEERTLMTQIKLNEIIPFNKTIKELISRYPDLGATDLAENLTQATGAIFSGRRKDHQNTFYEYTATVNGMRHEKAAEDLLFAANIDYDYRVSVEEDSQGNDLFVYLNGDWVGIDIKASYTAEARAYQRHKYSHAVWTTLSSDDFRGPTDDAQDRVSISYETAHEHALAFCQRIHKAVSGELREEHYQTHHQRARQRGRGAVQWANHLN